MVSYVLAKAKFIDSGVLMIEQKIELSTRIVGVGFFVMPCVVVSYTISYANTPTTAPKIRRMRGSPDFLSSRSCFSLQAVTEGVDESILASFILVFGVRVFPREIWHDIF